MGLKSAAKRRLITEKRVVAPVVALKVFWKCKLFV